MYNRDLGIFLCFLLFLPLEHNSQESIDFRTYSVKDGLSQNSVFAVIQDQEGFMWLGTRNGLNKFDGYEFRVFRHEPGNPASISNSDIRALGYDRLGQSLWIGTMDGLNRYDARTHQFSRYFFDEADSLSLSHNEITSILIDSKGRVWIGTRQGLNVYLHDLDEFVRLSTKQNGLSSDEISCLYEDEMGNVWIGTTNGLNKAINGKGNEVSFLSYLTEEADSIGNSGDAIQALTSDYSGNLWMGFKWGGLSKWNPKTGEIKRFRHKEYDLQSISHDNVRALSFDGEGNLWIGTFWGLNKYNEGKGAFERYFNHGYDESSLGSNSIKSIYKDRKGSLWIGSYFKGVSFFDPIVNRFKNYQQSLYINSLSYNVVSSFAEDSLGNIWVGTEGGGIDYFDSQNEVFTPLKEKFPHIPSPLISTKKILLEDKGLWIGTVGEGLIFIDTESKKWINYRSDNAQNTLNNDYVYTLLPDRQYLWIGTYGGGVSRLNKETGQIMPFVIDASSGLKGLEQVRVLFEDSSGIMWIGTEAGLYKVVHIAESGILTVAAYLGEEQIYCLHEDHKNRLWIGTFGSGLYALDLSTEHLMQYSVDEGLPGNSIFGVVEDQDSYFWISTDKGISKFNPQSSSFLNYGLSDGLINLEYNFNSYFISSQNEIFFGGSNGFTRFDPSKVSSNPYIPPVVFTELLQSNEVIDIDEEGPLNEDLNVAETLVFSYEQANFTLKFSALNYVSPEKNQYAYQMEGLESHWNLTTGQPSASYTIQDAGTYTFRLKAANNDGLWNPNIRTLKIRVLPPPWKTWWAFSLYTMALVAAILSLIGFMQMKSRLKQDLHLEQMHILKQEEIHQMKMRFFTNITHEFRTPLTLILGPIEELLSKEKGDTWSRNHLASIQRNGNRMLNLVNQLLMFRKLETDHLELNLTEQNMVSFLEEIYLAFSEHADKRSISYTFEADRPEILFAFDLDKMEKVIYNLLSNAFKFTEDGGRIEVKILGESQLLKILISDNGRGISSSKLPYIFNRFYETNQSFHPQLKNTGIGLAISRQLIELQNGEITVQSVEGKGTSFCIAFPYSAQQALSPERPFVRSNSFPSFATATKSRVLTIPEQRQTKPKNTILIIEDNDEVRAYLNQIFQSTYHTLLAPGVKKGLAIMEQELPDLIISDVMMPEMNGIELCKVVKHNLATCHIPVLLLTARTPLIFKLEGLENGADDYLTKPFHPEELTLRVKNLIQSRKELRERFVRIINLEPREITTSSADEQFLQKAMDVVEAEIENPEFNIESFAKDMAVSRALLFTKIKALTDQTPKNFIKSIRLKRAAQLLKKKSHTVSEVAYLVGFRDPKYFSKCFQQKFNTPPSAYSKEKVPS